MSSVARHLLLVAYDVRDPTRLRQTHRTMLGYGDPIQYSVFLCHLSPTEQAVMIGALLRVIRPSTDSVVVVDLGPSAGTASNRIRTIGPALVTRPARFHVV